jgi:K+-sensing histidine kinase KdpD
VEEKTVKKITFIASFSLVAVTMTTTALALEFRDKAAANAHAEWERQQVLEMNENFEKGKTDDAALKEAIISLPKLMVPNLDMFGSMAQNMTR